MSERTKVGLPLGILGVMIVGLIIFAVWAAVTIEARSNDCEAAGGVQVRGACIDRSVVIEP